jgi:hypothetical protein
MMFRVDHFVPCHLQGLLQGHPANYHLLGPVHHGPFHVQLELPGLADFPLPAPPVPLLPCRLNIGAYFNISGKIRNLIFEPRI